MTENKMIKSCSEINSVLPMHLQLKNMHTLW